MLLAGGLQGRGAPSYETPLCPRRILVKAPAPWTVSDLRAAVDGNCRREQTLLGLNSNDCDQSWSGRPQSGPTGQLLARSARTTSLLSAAVHARAGKTMVTV